MVWTMKGDQLSSSLLTRVFWNHEAASLSHRIDQTEPGENQLSLMGCWWSRIRHRDSGEGEPASWYRSPGSLLPNKKKMQPKVQLNYMLIIFSPFLFTAATGCVKNKTVTSFSISHHCDRARSGLEVNHHRRDPEGTLLSSHPVDCVVVVEWPCLCLKPAKMSTREKNSQAGKSWWVVRAS